MHRGGPQGNVIQAFGLGAWIRGSLAGGLARFQQSGDGAPGRHRPGRSDLPFDPHNHARLATILEDGKTLIARGLGLGRLPLSEPVSWVDWEARVRAPRRHRQPFPMPGQAGGCGSWGRPWSRPCSELGRGFHQADSPWAAWAPCAWRQKSIPLLGSSVDHRCPPHPLWAEPARCAAKSGWAMAARHGQPHGPDAQISHGLIRPHSPRKR
jgi:hypothetical protein